MDGQANNAPLLGQRAGNGLANPPGGIGAKLAAPARIELFHGLHQAQISLLNQIEERDALSQVFFRNADDESRIRLDQVRPRVVSALHLVFETNALFGIMPVLADTFRSQLAALHLLCKLNFLFSGEKGNTAHLFQVQADGIIDGDAFQVERLLEIDLRDLYFGTNLLWSWSLLFLYNSRGGRLTFLIKNDLDALVEQIEEEILEL